MDQKEPTSTPQPPTNPTAILKITMAVIFALWALMFVAVDVFAWIVGATATLSQVWLTINRNFWPATCLLAFICGVLQQHVSIPGPPGAAPSASFWWTSLAWLLFWLLGRLVAWRWLWQLPNMD